MNSTIHITSGDSAGDLIAKSGIPGEVFVWHDILYDGPRQPGWPDEETLIARAAYLEAATGGGLSRESIRQTLETQYARLKTLSSLRLVLWFDACLFDQSMLCHVLTCLRIASVGAVELICVDAFPGIEPYHGLGQLSPEQMASVYPRRRPVTPDQFDFAERVDRAFALQDRQAFEALGREADAPLPWVPAAVRRWLAEQPDETGLGRLERLALEAIRAGNNEPWAIFAAAAAQDTPPQFWTDISLRARINALADRDPPLAVIDGPEARLPQWGGMAGLERFRIRPG
ncbi:hypothetical protein [Methylococcus sp. Mc7]|uniref:hypothetical protein n=1 Tax=Methylococcus sp. Mc7 TaxID=2860258 RepID=UPI001C527B90|nr:hypothetical protein [Methylococcus sp. Mc7]QXP84985.1 hypothetical protein KW115_04415 [Methylococcus sp. Mc7]